MMVKKVKKVCTKEHPFDKNSGVKPNEYWDHPSAVNSAPDYDGEIIFLHCPICGLDYSMDCRGL